MTLVANTFILEEVQRYRQSVPTSPDSAEIADWLDIALNLLRTIQSIDLRHQSQVRLNQIPFDRAEAEGILRLYELWAEPCSALLQSISDMEARGIHLENAARFREACRASPIPGLEADRLNTIADQFNIRPGRPLDEVMDGIRRRALR